MSNKADLGQLKLFGLLVSTFILCLYSPGIYNLFVVTVFTTGDISSESGGYTG